MWNKKKKTELIESKDRLVIPRGKQWGVTEMGEAEKIPQKSDKFRDIASLVLTILYCILHI